MRTFPSTWVRWANSGYPWDGTYRDAYVGKNWRNSATAGRAGEVEESKEGALLQAQRHARNIALPFASTGKRGQRWTALPHPWPEFLCWVVLGNTGRLGGDRLEIPSVSLMGYHRYLWWMPSVSENHWNQDNYPRRQRLKSNKANSIRSMGARGYVLVFLSSRKEFSPLWEWF